jgi:hypothetical protein
MVWREQRIDLVVEPSETSRLCKATKRGMHEQRAPVDVSPVIRIGDFRKEGEAAVRRFFRLRIV